jgi:hypothetical protein
MFIEPLEVPQIKIESDSITELISAVGKFSRFESRVYSIGSQKAKKEFDKPLTMDPL